MKNNTSKQNIMGKPRKKGGGETYQKFISMAAVLFFAASIMACNTSRSAMTLAEQNYPTAIKNFYSKMLSNASSPQIEAISKETLAENYVSTPASIGGNGRAGFVKTLQGYSAIIPDLKWEVEEVIRSGNRYTVRGIGTGTPVKKFLGIPPSGKSFKVRSIDILTIENGKIVEVYHIEDWATAMRQLR